MKENNNCGRDKKKQQPETDSLTFRAGDTFYEVDRSALKLPELRVLLLFSGYWLL